MSEDCLYLSIWSPQPTSNSAVIVWLRSADEDDIGTLELSQKGGVVVVEVNSREGVLGFLNTEESIDAGRLLKHCLVYF